MSVNACAPILRARDDPLTVTVFCQASALIIADSAPARGKPPPLLIRGTGSVSAAERAFPIPVFSAFAETAHHLRALLSGARAPGAIRVAVGAAAEKGEGREGREGREKDGRGKDGMGGETPTDPNAVCTADSAGGSTLARPGAPLAAVAGAEHAQAQAGPGPKATARKAGARAVPVSAALVYRATPQRPAALAAPPTALPGCAFFNSALFSFAAAAAVFALFLYARCESLTSSLH